MLHLGPLSIKYIKFFEKLLNLRIIQVKTVIMKGCMLLPLELFLVS